MPFDQTGKSTDDAYFTAPEFFFGDERSESSVISKSIAVDGREVVMTESTCPCHWNLGFDQSLPVQFRVSSLGQL